jgi:hypothetical protein
MIEKTIQKKMMGTAFTLGICTENEQLANNYEKTL